MAKIVLTRDVPKLGKMGDVKTVADGFARNYLVPKKLAAAYSAGLIADLQARSKARLSALEVQAKEALNLKTKIEKARLEFSVLVDEKGELYGSIGKGQILRALKSKDLSWPKTASLVLRSPLKSLGEFKVPLQLHPDVIAQISVAVVKSEASK